MSCTYSRHPRGAQSGCGDDVDGPRQPPVGGARLRRQPPAGARLDCQPPVGARLHCRPPVVGAPLGCRCSGRCQSRPPAVGVGPPLQRMARAGPPLQRVREASRKAGTLLQEMMPPPLHARPRLLRARPCHTILQGGSIACHAMCNYWAIYAGCCMHIPSKVAYSCPENVETTLRLMLTTGPHYGLSYCGCRFHGKFKLQSKGPSDLGLSRREDSLRGPASLHRYCLACANQCANHFYRAMCPSHCEIQNHAYIVQPRQTYRQLC